MEDTVSPLIVRRSSCISCGSGAEGLSARGSGEAGPPPVRTELPHERPRAGVFGTEAAGGHRMSGWAGRPGLTTPLPEPEDA